MPIAKDAKWNPPQVAHKSLLSPATVAFGERLSSRFCFDPCHRNKRVGNREHFGSTHSSPRLLRDPVSCGDPATIPPHCPCEARPQIVSQGTAKRRRVAAVTQRDSLLAPTRSARHLS